AAMPMASGPKLLLPGQPLSVSSGQQPRPQLGAGTYARGDYILSSLVGYEQRQLSRLSSASSTNTGTSKGGGGAGAGAGMGTGETVSTIAVSGLDNRFVVPRPESVVIGRVTRVTPRQAYLSILIVDGQPCGASSSTSSTHVSAGPGNHAAGEGEGTDFQGVVRSQDVRTTEKDKVKLADCFRPGDIVRAAVISLGDARSYYLSTAANNLGVIYATSASSATPTPPPTSNSNSTLQQDQHPSTADSASPAATTWSAQGPGWNITGSQMLPISWQEMIDPLTGTVEKRKCAKPDAI
ncbi:hypothetical protein BCV70DRAFT_142496, partial [Testicularia cyperi]